MGFSILVYALSSALGLLLLKISAMHGIGFEKIDAGFSLRLNYYFIAGLIFYATSFLLSLYIMRTSNLTFFYPIAIGMGYVFVCILGICVLKETVTIKQVVGMGLIFLGVLVMNWNNVKL